MLLVFGDSHSMIWGGRLPEGIPQKSRFPLVDVNHLGAALAYNLMGDGGQPGKWGMAILAALAAHGPTYSAIMLCFGEIDVRSHIIKQAAAQNASIDEIAATVIDRYMKFVDILRARTEAPIFLWGPIPSAKDFCDWDPSYPYVGSQSERNLATKSFNRQLTQQGKTRKGVYPFDIFDELTVRGFLTKEIYYPDKRHLGIEALDLAIQAFDKIVRENNLDLPDFFGASSFDSGQKPQIKDISASARVVRLSSCMDGRFPVRIDQQHEGLGYIFHTNKDDRPAIVIDLGYSAMLCRLQIYNRFDGEKDRARSLEILIGDNPDAAHVIYQHNGNAFGLDNAPIDLKLEGAPPTRYVVLRLREKEFFHLGKISIFAKSFL